MCHDTTAPRGSTAAARLKERRPAPDVLLVRESELAPASREDEMADEAVARGRNAGGVWIVGAVIAFGLGLFAGSFGTFVIAWAVGLALFAIGLVTRARYWRAARRRLGDATIQRALWRTVDGDHERSDRTTTAVVIVLALLAFELWRN